MYSIDNNRLAKQISDLSNTYNCDSGGSSAAGLEQGPGKSPLGRMHQQLETVGPRP